MNPLALAFLAAPAGWSIVVIVGTFLAWFVDRFFGVRAMLRKMRKYSRRDDGGSHG